MFKRLLLVMSVAALMAALVVATAVPAFAGPFSPGPNSVEAVKGFYEDQNFGNCQSDTAKEPSPASDAQEDNPALYTKGQPFGAFILCS
jgi:hypothetical protein